MYLIRSSSSACTIAIAPRRAHSSSSVRAEPLSSRIPVWVVVRSVVKNLNVTVPSATASAIEAMRRVGGGAGEDGVEGEVGVRARVEDPAAVLDGDARVELLTVDVDVHERERDDGRRAAEECGARGALRRLQPLLTPLRPAFVHRLVDVRVRLDAAREDELAGRVDHAARLGRGASREERHTRSSRR